MNLAGRAARAAGSRTRPCYAGSGATSDLSASFSFGAPAPYRWSWQDDAEPAPALELDPAAVAAANGIADLTNVLRAAADAAPPRACLTPTARSLLDRAVQRLVPGREGPAPATGSAQRADPVAPPAAGCSVSQAAALLEAYGKSSQGQLSEISGSSSGSSSRSTSGESGGAAPDPLVATILAHVCCSPGGSGAAAAAAPVNAASSREVADLLWALSEVQEDMPWDDQTATLPSERTPVAAAPQEGSSSAQPVSTASVRAAVAAQAPAALQRAVLARVRGQDFLAPDLCRAVCALGSLAASGSGSGPGSGSVPGSGSGSGSASVVASVSGSSSSGTATALSSSSAQVDAGSSSSWSSSGGGSGSGASAGFRLDPELVKALNEEIRFQLTEFDADFSAEDLARLISGMSRLRLGAAVAADEEYRRILMKAVYGKTRSIVDKAAVDFALSGLLTDDPEARSMHYDTRWTHEELRWLPRRERDKRRIIKEGWYRTKWGGWSPGGQS